jgi:kynurenine formamidase
MMKRFVVFGLLVLWSVIGGQWSVVSGQGILEKIMQGKGRMVDLTHPLSPKIPYWPGETYKPFHFEVIATLEKDGVFSGYFAMPEHTGTHIDAPNHFVAGQIPVDAINLRQLIAPAVVIDARETVAKNPDYQLTVAAIEQWEKTHGRIPRGALVFLYTGWDARWNDMSAYRNQDEKKVMHFPGFSPESAEFLVQQRSLSGIGIDTLSVDYGPSKDFRVHHITHGAGKYHVENAANLGQLPPTGAIVIVAPLPIEGGSGSPARVFALVEISNSKSEIRSPKF